MRRRRHGGAPSGPAASITALTTISTGAIRFTHRRYKCRSENIPDATSWALSRVIMKPEVTKKMSTPATPTGTHAGAAWNNTTASTAMARKLSISAR